MRKILIALLLFNTVLALAQTNEIQNNKADVGLWKYIERHSWKLIQLDGQLQEESTAYLLFDASQKTVKGNASCNAFSAHYEADAEHILLSNVVSTEMMCDKMPIEDRILQVLQTPQLRYDVADQTLNFYLDNKLVLMFGASCKPTMATTNH